MFKLLSGGLKLTCLLLAILTVPLLIELEYVLQLWLGIIPEYTVNICRLTLVFNYFAGISILLAVIIHATGRMKRISFLNGTIYLMVLPVTYAIFKFGITKPWIPFLLNIIGIFIGVINNLWSIKLYIASFDFRKFLLNDYFASLALFFGCWAVCWPLTLIMPQGIERLITVTLVSGALIGSIGYFFYIPAGIKVRIREFAARKLSIKKIFA